MHVCWQSRSPASKGLTYLASSFQFKEASLYNIGIHADLCSPFSKGMVAMLGVEMSDMTLLAKFLLEQSNAFCVGVEERQRWLE